MSVDDKCPQQLLLNLVRERRLKYERLEQKFVRCALLSLSLALVLGGTVVARHDNALQQMSSSIQSLEASIKLDRQRGLIAMQRLDANDKRLDDITLTANNANSVASDALQRVAVLEEQSKRLSDDNDDAISDYNPMPTIAATPPLSIEGRVYPTTKLLQSVATGTYLQKLAVRDKLPLKAAQAKANLRAMLDTISECEGTSEHGFYTHVGGTRVKSLNASFPCWVHRAAGSDACGRYQIISPTWRRCKKALGLHVFSPKNQEKCAIWLIEKAGVLADVKKGDVKAALPELSRIWASLPPDRYGQHPKSEKFVLATFEKYGGKII